MKKLKSDDKNHQGKIRIPKSKLEQDNSPAQHDHIKLGQELDLFMSNEKVGKGLPLLTPRGATLKRVLTRFVEDEEIIRGYEFTATPAMANRNLFKLSGHWDLYKENMFVIGDKDSNEESEEVLAMRPMTCPHQFMVYNRKAHTYRELPIRYAETSSLFRNEASGSMHGLIRMRQFTLSEGHIICLPNQLEKEFEQVLDLISFILESIGLTEYTYRFSKWDPQKKEKYIDNPEAWEESQAILKRILDKSGVSYVEAEGEAAFYGPKLDIQMKNAWGKEDTAITVQMDYALAERFDMTYVDENGNDQHPVIIHRSSIGCYERTMALLIEHFGGRLPFWLAPQQVEILTINDSSREGALNVNKELMKAGIRSSVCPKNDTLRKKVRNAQLMQIPVIVTLGNREIEEDTVSVRTLEGVVLQNIPLESFIEQCIRLNTNRRLDFSFE